MVATPWGDSEKLRERSLSPGRATPAEEVAANQRTRIFAATVASVAEVGYAATGVSEISEISGVSTRSFYDLFPGGKDECFASVLDEVLGRTLDALSTADEGEDRWEERIGAIYQRFAWMVASQPATGALILTEAHAAGPDATKMLEVATDSLERLLRTRIDESPERSGMPPAMVGAHVGALQELARARLREGRDEDLPALVPGLVSLLGSYRPPPGRLRHGGRRLVVESEVVASSETLERAIRGFILAVAEHGYGGATIQRIARSGQMGVNSFYATFSDRRSVLLAAVDSSTAQMVAIALAAYRRSPGWAAGVRAAIAGMLGFFAARPATANLLLAEIFAGGAEAVEVRADRLTGLVGILEERAPESPEVPPVAPEAIVGAIVSLARSQLLRKGAESLPSLAPIATYIALAPYLGPEEAFVVSNRDGRPRPSSGVSGRQSARAARHTKWNVIAILGDHSAGAGRLAEEIGASVGEVAAYLEELEADGLVDRIPGDHGPDGAEWLSTRRFRLIDEEDWAGLTVEERREHAGEVVSFVAADLEDGLRRRVFGVRPADVQARLLLALDEEGWDELSEVHRAAFHAAQAIKMKSERRLRESGRRPIEGRSVQLLFELPDGEVETELPESHPGEP